MQQSCRSPRVREVQFISTQPTAVDECTSTLSVAIFREVRERVPPNLPQPMPSFLCRVRSTAEGWAMWGRAYWNGRGYAMSRYITEATAFFFNGNIEVITLTATGQHQAVGDAINDDIIIPPSASCAS